MALDPTNMSLMTLGGLSEEAMWAHVGVLGAAPPILVHKSVAAEQVCVRVCVPSLGLGGGV